MPFVRSHCRSHGVGMWTMGASLGGYHAANTLLKHPDAVKRCFALSGVYDMKRFMLGDYDDNFYFNNPVDYCANLIGRLGAASPRELRHPPGDRHRPVGTPGRGVPAVRAFSRAAASGTASTTGARMAGTTGRTGATDVEYMNYV